MGQPSYPSYPAPVPPKPPISGADLAVSITALVVTVLVGAVGAVFGLFSLAFLDYCPAPRCSIDGAVTAVMTAVGAALVIGVAGLVVTVVQLFRRKRGWPFAVGTLVLCVIALVCGGVGYAIAVG
jgi:hypothetical protein